MIVGAAGSRGNLPDPCDGRACEIVEARQHYAGLGNVPPKKKKRR